MCKYSTTILTLNLQEARKTKLMMPSASISEDPEQFFGPGAGGTHTKGWHIFSYQYLTRPSRSIIRDRIHHHHILPSVMCILQRLQEFEEEKNGCYPWWSLPVWLDVLLKDWGTVLSTKVSAAMLGIKGWYRWIDIASPLTWRAGLYEPIARPVCFQVFGGPSEALREMEGMPLALVSVCCYY